ncbi:hypothetical protein RHGRI_030878 [Rhododendron griersonianum]|uniref:Zinc finger GRF-type domain-containing protein n=1 Tax=Rhododendron griersonianum TaxID=479676 RepID=A0AAV6I9H6_9ERIC|nr:hypothetical protein RHGRI_030878 [Rhododendron griersonianum]
MASASSNATSGWPRRPCACGFGPCIPTQAGPKSKYPSRYYYRCPRDKSCKWMGWCDDENGHNVAHAEDDRSLQLTIIF